MFLWGGVCWEVWRRGGGRECEAEPQKKYSNVSTVNLLKERKVIKKNNLIVVDTK
jgi:hypothetical protein